MKANIPAAICLIVLGYWGWMFYRAKHRSILKEPETQIVITVHGPDGTIIPVVGPADGQPDNSQSPAKP